MKIFIRDACFSIAFFQIVLTPYLIWYLGLDMTQYGKWCLANMGLSAVMGPAFARLYRWIFSGESDKVG